MVLCFSPCLVSSGRQRRLGKRRLEIANTGWISVVIAKAYLNLTESEVSEDGLIEVFGWHQPVFAP